MNKKQYLTVTIIILIIIGIVLVYLLLVHQNPKKISQPNTQTTQQSSETNTSSSNTSNTTYSSSKYLLRGPITRIDKTGNKINFVVIDADISSLNLNESKRSLILNVNDKTKFYDLQASVKNTPLSPDKLKVGDRVLVELDGSTKQLIANGQNRVDVLSISR